jgi:NAD(P)-dependent dehydrogenase (short-subunit alcohol dehydrogenase family)
VRSADAEPPAAPPGGAREVRNLTVDLSTRESIEEAAGSLPPLDLLVNNAGLMTGGLLEEQDTDDIYAMFQVNLVGLVHLTKLVLPGMVERGRGTIVNNASISGYAWFPATTTYAAAKTGVVAFSESLRRELRGTGVQVLHLVTLAWTRTCSTTPDGSTAATWTPTPGATRARRSGRPRSCAPWSAAITCWDRAGRLALAKLASRGRRRCWMPSRGPMFTREAAVGRLGEQHLHVLDAALGEPALDQAK